VIQDLDPDRLRSIAQEILSRKEFSPGPFFDPWSLFLRLVNALEGLKTDNPAAYWAIVILSALVLFLVLIKLVTAIFQGTRGMRKRPVVYRLKDKKRSEKKYKYPLFPLLEAASNLAASADFGRAVTMVFVATAQDMGVYQTSLTNQEMARAMETGTRAGSYATQRMAELADRGLYSGMQLFKEHYMESLRLRRNILGEDA